MVNVNSLVLDFIEESRFQRHISENNLIDLVKNYFNRFLPSDQVEFSIPESGHVIVKLGGVLEEPDIIEFENSYLKGSGWNAEFSYNLNDQWLIEFHVEDLVVERPMFLYHAAPSKLENEIMRNGLKPTRQFKFQHRYPKGRLFFLRKKDLNVMRALMRGRFGKNVAYTVFEFDTRKFKRFNLFKDEAFHGVAVYTKTHIPSNALEIIERSVT